MTFERRIEDFTCEHCDNFVKGAGYTNHCPQCLWSKHVDNEPGDRAATCGGMMAPILVERDGEEWILTHTCTKCGYTKRNKMSRGDNFDVASRLGVS